MPKKITDILNATTLQDYSAALEVDNGLLDALFPETKINEFELEYFVGADGLPVAASVHAAGSETEIGDREGFELMKHELAAVRRKIALDAKDARVLRSPRDSRELQAKIEKVFNDANNMSQAVRTRFKSMAFEALSTGKITMNENDYRGLIDYKLPADHKITIEKSWLDPTAKPLEDLKKWQSKILSDTGVKPTRVLTSERVALLIEGHETIRKAMYGLNSEMLITRVELNQFLAKMGLPTIVTYDEQYRKKEAGKLVTKRYWPEDVLAMFPEGKLGDLTYGVTDEELVFEETGSPALAKVGNIVLDTYFENDPPKRWIKASGVALPSFPQANKVMIVNGLLAEVPEEEEEEDTEGE